MQNRIRWNSEEIGRVASQAITTLAKKYNGDLFGAIDSVPRTMVEDALYAAQRAELPADRHKRDFGDLIYKRLSTQVRHGLRKEAARRKQLAGQAVVYTPTPAVVEEPSTVTVDQFSLAEVIWSLGGAIADGMRLAYDAEPEGAAEILGAIFGTAQPAANDERNRKPPMRTHQPEPTRAARKPKVAIIGLLDSQRRAIEREMPHLDLRFWGKGDMTQRVGAITAHADKVIVMTKFVSHMVVKQIRSKYISVNGGMTALARALNDQYAVAAVA